MTDNIKVISRPRVRFRQFSDDSRNEEIVDDHGEQAATRASGPRVEEFVSLEEPVGAVDPEESTSDGDIPLGNCSVDTSSHHGITSGDVRNISSSGVIRVESRTILHDADDIRNTVKGCKMPQLDESPQDEVPKDRTKCSRQKGKENKHAPRKTVSSKSANEPRTGSSRKTITRDKFRLATGDDCRAKINARPGFREPKMTKSQSAPSVMKKPSPTVQGVLNAKPVAAPSRVTSRCKTAAKNKISPVKKVVLRNVSGPKIKTSVRPGVFRKRQNYARINDANEHSSVMSDVTVDLAQPEYNSIICTINKLRELERQKIVTDINHLPPALKNFLNGKVNFLYELILYVHIYMSLSKHLCYRFLRRLIFHWTK